jgi:LacI family transcriptional regulator
MGSPKRITLAEVARDAGVSRATASLVVRDAGKLSPGTRLRVRASMESLGYVYHRGAASLRASRTNTVGLIVPDISNSFTAEMTMAIEALLSRSDKTALVAISLEDPAHQERLARSMLERRVDGILLIPALGTDRSVIERLGRSGVPVLLVTRDIAQAGLSFVGIDNRQGGRLAGEHLLSHGVGSVSYLGGYAELGPRRDRLAGVRGALKGSTVRVEVELAGPPTGSWGLASVHRLIESGGLTDGIVCHNDNVAFGAFRALRAARVGQRVRIVSFDDVAAAPLWEPPLTTVAADGKQLGELSVEVLMRYLTEGPRPAERVLVSPRLIVRESCGCQGWNEAGTAE